MSKATYAKKIQKEVGEGGREEENVKNLMKDLFNRFMAHLFMKI